MQTIPFIEDDQDIRKLIAQAEPAQDFATAGAGGCGHSAVVPVAYWTITSRKAR